jgi:orotate phosphoribosyltransferase-like protein
MDKYYKGDKVASNGMSEQHIFEVKQMWHSGFGASHIADELKLSVNQTLIAINQNEEKKIEFTERDFL